jgi:iron complex transport system substrate-binding protein
VYEQAHQAQFWVGVGQYNALQELADADERYKNFAAFQQGNVYSYMARVGPKGGNEYFELGYARPDIILADLIKIFHPQLLPAHELYFHEKLE